MAPVLAMHQAAGVRRARLARKFFGGRPRESTQPFRVAVILLPHKNCRRDADDGHNARAGEVIDAERPAPHLRRPVAPSLIYQRAPPGSSGWPK